MGKKSNLQQESVPEVKASIVIQGKRKGTGINGLDFILSGGFPKERIYLIHGGPGTGKTTLSFQFLLEGARCGEKVLYITLLQSRVELDDVIKAHGWSIKGLDILELPKNFNDSTVAEQTLFSPSEVELSKVTDEIVLAIKKYKPNRFVLDSVSELSVLVDSSYQLRRQLLKLKGTLQTSNCTSIITAGETAGEDIASIQTIVHGVIKLSQQSPVYSEVRRQLEVTKMRGMSYQGGCHDIRIRTGGIDVFPRILITEQKHKLGRPIVASGNIEIDTLLGGGLEKGTSCLITGTTGAGKSTLGSIYVEAAAKRGEHSAIFCFDERKETFMRRCKGLSININKFIEKGFVNLRQMNVGEHSPGEFTEMVRQSVERDNARVILIDSLTGYLAAMPEEKQLIAQLHELLSYLSSAGVLSLMVVTTQALSSPPGMTIDTSYLADTVVLLRHFEAMGSMRRCISVIKKRHGKHETTIREVKIDSTGIHLGPALTEFSGVLTGTPRFEGSHEQLMKNEK